MKELESIDEMENGLEIIKNFYKKVKIGQAFHAKHIMPIYPYTIDTLRSDLKKLKIPNVMGLDHKRYYCRPESLDDLRKKKVG